MLETDEIRKTKVVYIAGYLAHKHHEEFSEEDEGVDSDFVTELSRGRLKIPTLNMVHFVNTAIFLYEKIEDPHRNCTKYVRNLLSFVDSPISSNRFLCKRLTNVMFKADVLNRSDKENLLGCLRRKEKLK